MSTIALPEVEPLIISLADQMRPHISRQTGLVGIVTGGAWLAERLHELLKVEVPCGALDTSFYRDDFRHQGLKRGIEPSTIPFEIDGRDLILVDDVLYTGRTIRAAMNELFDYGRPARIRLAALIDRGGRQLPIAAQFIGATIDLPADQNIELLRNAKGRLTLSLAPALGAEEP